MRNITTTVINLQPRNTTFIDDLSKEVYESTYKYGEDKDINDTHLRVAKDIALAEKEEERDSWTSRFLDVLEHFQFVPGGRITSNAGTGLRGTTYINCFTQDALVLTDHGYVPINEVLVGDRVLTHRGHWKRVVNTLSRTYVGHIDRYKSSLLTGDLCSTPKHPFYQGNDEWKASIINSRIVLPFEKPPVATQKIQVKNYLENTVLRYLKEDHTKIYTEVPCIGGQGALLIRKGVGINKEVTLTTELAYALGRFVGDGCTFQQYKNSRFVKTGFNIAFNEQELDSLNRVKTALEYSFDIKLNINRSGPQQRWYIRKSCAVLASFLHNAIGDKSTTKRVPSFIWQAPLTIKKEFLLGLFDADGTVSKVGELKITLANEALIDDIQALSSLVGVPLRKRKEKYKYLNAQPTFILSCGDKECNYILRACLTKTYADNRLVRKAQKKTASNFSTSLFKSGDNYCCEDFIKKQEHFTGTVYNLSVEDDESYVVNNVVVHNCFVEGFTGQHQDSMISILETIQRQALILKSEGGYGICMDTLRPRGAFISAIANESPGAVKMMDMWDTTSAVITAGSGRKRTHKNAKEKIRKGAQMATMSCWHPDIEEFITAKKTPGRLTKFNMSVLVTDSFMTAVREHKPWKLEFPDFDHSPEVKKTYNEIWNGNIKAWKKKRLPVKIYKEYEDANDLWDLIMQSTYAHNEPGVLFVDTINKLNNLWYCEYISATNPCGEQVLPIGGACLLGSLNLTQFVDLEKKDWDYKKLADVIPVAVRFMDDVNDRTQVPLESQADNLKSKRRIGLGVMGYGSALLMMKVRYGSKKALQLTEKLMRFIMNQAYQASAKLAGEKGAFPLFDKESYLKSKFVKRLDKETIEIIKKHGMRNSHVLSIQPTGNSSALANVVTGGLEPLFLGEYIRTVVQAAPPDGLNLPKYVDWDNKIYEADKEWEWINEGDENLLRIEYEGEVYKVDNHRGLTKEKMVTDYAVRILKNKGEWDPKAKWAACAMNLNLEAHIDTMTVFSKYIDSAMSKTVNIPNDYPYEKFKKLYEKVHGTKTIKGCTTYRVGTMASVLAAKNGNKITRKTAPKRPATLPCDIHHFNYKDGKWIALVGLLKGQPYEVFAFRSRDVQLSPRIKSGRLTKRSMRNRAKYDLECEDGTVLRDIASHFDTGEEETITRLMSALLRHGGSIEVGIAQLLKSQGTVVSFNKIIARTLKRYLNGKLTLFKCPQCGSKNLQMTEGCVKCIDCGMSKCD